MSVTRDSSEERGGERSQAEFVALTEALDAYGAILDTFEDGVFFADPDGVFVKVNTAACKQLGYTRDELVGMSLAKIVVRPNFDFGAVRQRLQAAGQLTYESVHRKKSGEVFPVLITLTSVPDLGEWRMVGIARDLTEQRRIQTGRERAEIALRQSEARYRSLVENLPGSAILLFDHDLRFVLVDGPEVEATGFSKATMEGQKLHECLPPEFAELVEPNLRATLAGKTFNMDLPFEDRIYHYEYLPLRNDRGEIEFGFILAQNVTARHRAEEELERRERQYRMLANHLPDMVARFDRQHRLLYVNPTVEHQSGLPAEALKGKTNLDIGLHPEKATIWQTAIERTFETGQEQRLETDVTGPHGVRYWDARLVPERGPGGAIESVLAISRDVTERRQREEELQKKNEELMRFTYAVSHDLRSPLVTIKSFLAFLEQDIGTKDAAGIERDLGYIRTAAGRMGQLLDELLELSRVGRQVRVPEWLSLQDLVQQARALVAGRIATARTQVEVTDMPVTLYGDRARLLEIFQNLLDNAVKFSASVASPRVVIGATPVGEEIVISITDNGIGIDPRHVHKLFGLFEKLHPEAEGTGIGLALVKRIVEVHGGRVWVESPGVGHGTTVRFTLPRTKCETRGGDIAEKVGQSSGNQGSEPQG